jgi:hypothetical protein
MWGKGMSEEERNRNVPVSASIIDNGDAKALKVAKRKIIRWLLVVLILIVSVFGTCAYLMPYPEARMVGIEVSLALKEHVCKVEYRVGDPCGTRNVQYREGMRNWAIIFIDGVNDEMEINRLVEIARSSRRIIYKKTSIKMLFYSDLLESRLLHEIIIKGE